MTAIILNARRRRAWALLTLVGILLTLVPVSARTTQPIEPAVLNVQTISAQHAAQVLRTLYPRDRITVDARANAVIVVAPEPDVTAMRAVVAGIDVRNPTSATVEAIPLHAVEPGAMAAHLHALFPSTRIVIGPNKTLLVSADAQDMAQIKTVVASTDLTSPSPSPRPEYPAVSVRVSQTSARTVARIAARSVPHTRVAVDGSSIILTGPDDEVTHAKALIAQLDQPQPGIRYTEVYRLHFVDASSVADLLKKSYRDIQVEVDKDLNALTVLGTYTEQQRIADSIAQLDASPFAGAGAGIAAGQPGSSSNAGSGAGGADVDIVNLKAAVPGLNGAPSTSASDIAQTVTQALQAVAPDLHVTVPPNSTQLVLTGSQYSITLAKRLIGELDVAQPLVVLDTEILEVDETVAKNLGLEFASPLITTTFTEVQPLPDPTTGVTPPLTSLQPFSRTPLSLGLQLNLLVQNGSARILADPRITVISGRTASIRAGDTISILTTTGGGAGTIATTQLQSFQTGVTLDITPVVNAENYISVTLHPSVNSLTGTLNGVPQIATRDAQTTVGLGEDQTLVIGGLIQDSTNRTETKMPILGDLPLVGKAFRNETLNKNRNELIVTVTPHVIKPGQPYLSAGPPLPAIPTPEPLPTLPPGTTLPQPRNTPTPAPSPTPYVAPLTPPPSMATPSAGAPSAATSSAPSPTPAPQGSAAPAPAPTPSAFANLNVFTYGQAPNSNYAKPTDPAQIFFVQFSPTVIRNNTPVTINAITTTNAKRMTITYNQVQTQISQTSPGVWQSTYNFNTGGGLGGATNLTLTVTKDDGSVVTASIPVTIVQK
ncbi:MAG: secretin N-terminal domain-containing protein [Vulcanimicrobiaceae bacterium]